MLKELVVGYEKETKDVTNLMRHQISDVGKEMSHLKFTYKDLNQELLMNI